MERCFGGIGIGALLPDPLHEIPRHIYKQATDAVVEVTGLPCVVENNVSAYADYLRYTRKISDYVLISIRTGVGGSVILENKLVRGLGYAS